MKYKIVMSLMLFASSLTYAQEAKIEANKSAFHVGESIMACGKLAQIKHLENRHYLNLDKPYPNQTLTILVWNSDYRWFESRFGSLDAMNGRRICARGVIEQYKNSLQIEVKNPQFLRLMTQ